MANNNTPNRPGVLRPTGANRSSQIVTTIIPAGASFPIFQPGNEFYLVLATAQVFIQPNSKSEGGYTQGTGLILDESETFNQVQVRNPNAFSVVISLFVGFGGFIDNRTILFNPLINNIVYPTSVVANSLQTIAIPDLTGTPLVDINGNNYLALERVGIYVSNLDLATAYSIQDFALSIPARVAMVVQPLFNIVFPVAGNFKIHVPAGTINAVVTEIYAAVKPGLT